MDLCDIFDASTSELADELRRLTALEVRWEIKFV